MPGAPSIPDDDVWTAATFQSLVRNALDTFVILEGDGAVRYVSPAVERIMGYPPDALSGITAVGLAHPDDQAPAVAAFAEALAQPNACVPFEMRFRHQDGAWRWFEVVYTNLLADPDVAGIIALVREISDRKRIELTLAHRALHDPLTGLPNRLYVLQVLKSMLAGPGRPLVFFLDLDRFKVVNDGFGHSVGDEVLAQVAHRLVETAPAGAMVARFGGDEFALLVTADDGAPEELAERFVRALAEPFTIGEGKVYLGASVGVALADDPETTPDDLLRHADIALCHAKAEGGGVAVTFQPWMAEELAAELAQESALRHAIDNGQLSLHYQPIVDLASNRVIGLEALVRWPQACGTPLLPGSFLARAEASGLMLPLGRWVVREACRQMVAWLPAGGAAFVAVNLAEQQLRSPDLVRDIAETLAEVGLPPHRLRLEVTEHATMENATQAQHMLAELHRLGVRLAIDDFGTGHSSLSRLSQLPIETLKIDRSFTNALREDPKAHAIVRAVTTLAHDLGMSVTAEGVEHAADVAELRMLGVDHGQGYYFAAPMPAAMAERLLVAPGCLKAGLTGGAIARSA